MGVNSAYTVGPRTVTATCTAGKKVVGGGFEVRRAGQPHRVLVLGNLPSAEDTWSVVARSWGNQNNRSFEIRAYALCVIA